MKKQLALLTWAIGLSIGISPIASAEVFRGLTPGGAKYLIQTPENWRAGQGLVIVNHGFAFDVDNGDPSLGPTALKNRMLQQGFALAASSYSTTGWATFQAERDLNDLLGVVGNTLGHSMSNIGPVYLSGGSLGGLISVQQAETVAAQRSLPGVQVKGILSLCPPLAGSVVWDSAIDFRVSYDAICDNTGGGDLPAGPNGAPWLLKPGDVAQGGSNTTFIELAASAAKCVGYEVPSALQSAGMRERRAKLLNATGVTEPFLGSLLFYSTFALSDLVYSPKKLGFGINLADATSFAQPFETRDINYGNADLNTKVRRLSSDPMARFQLMRNYTPSGRIGSAKLLTISTSGDGLVVPEHLRYFDDVIPTNQWRRALVQESTPSHCGFTDGELLGSWDRLLSWSNASAATQNAIAPTPASLNSACIAGLPDGGPGATECRFASAEALASLDTKIKPRTALYSQPPIDAGINGDWYSPSRSGEGFRVEALSDGRALVNFFSYPKLGEVGEQLWLTGVGQVTANGLHVEEMYRTRGARFGANYRPSDVQVERWGTLSMVLDNCGSGIVSFSGPAGFGSAKYPVIQLSRQMVPCFTRQALQAETGLSGTWYDTTRSGEGLMLTVQNSLMTSLHFFTYTPTGEQAWFVAQLQLKRETGRRTAGGTLYTTKGARFGTAFNSGDVRVESFGTVELTFTSCQNLTVTLSTPWGAQNLTYGRLTAPLGTDSCAGF
jgi:hypothetical protein